MLVSDILPDDAGSARVLERLGERAKYVSCDVADPHAVHRAMQRAVELFGGVDVSISNAGVVTNRPFLEVGQEDFMRTLSVNLLGSVWFSPVVQPARQMLKNPPQPKNLASAASCLFTGSWVQSLAVAGRDQLLLEQSGAGNGDESRRAGTGK